jgi:transcriptional regulatory protein LEU3
MLADHYRYLSGMIELYGIAINLIQKFAELDADTDYAHYASFYHTRTLLLAAYVVLKLHRTPPELSIDRGIGESCYFKVIALLRKKSLHSTFEADLDLKAAVLLTQLWSSTTVFRNAQGHTDSLSVRIRSRMVCPRCRSQLTSAYGCQSMNVFFDCAWWWRQEFRGEPDPFATATQATDIDQLANFPDFVYDGNYFGLYGDALSVPVSHGWT